MRNLGWISVLLLGAVWAYLDLFGTQNIPLVDKIINHEIEPLDPQAQPIEAGYVPGKSPDAQKAELHIIDSLRGLPEEGPVHIISKKIISNPREDGIWTEEWIAKKGNVEIPIKIDFGMGNK
jgi:hypothetical protein